MEGVSSVPKAGVWAWSFVGFVVATIIVLTAFAGAETDVTRARGPAPQLTGAAT
jgi:hypothetical protein